MAVGRLPGGIRWATFWWASTPQMTSASKSLPVSWRPHLSMWSMMNRFITKATMLKAPSKALWASPKARSDEVWE